MDRQAPPKRYTGALRRARYRAGSLIALSEMPRRLRSRHPGHQFARAHVQVSKEAQVQAACSTAGGTVLGKRLWQADGGRSAIGTMKRDSQLDVGDRSVA